MKDRDVSKAEMARRMHTSPAALDRLLDPDYDAVTLSILRKAATPVGERTSAGASVRKGSQAEACATVGWSFAKDGHRPGRLLCLNPRAKRGRFSAEVDPDTRPGG